MCTMITLFTMRLFFVCCMVFAAECINVDDKLDFHHPSALNDNSRYMNKAHFVPIKVSKTISSVKPGDNFEYMGVVCATGDCNKTMTSGETVKTEVFVHIETNVDLKKKYTSNKPSDNISEVPILAGFSGAKLDLTSEDIMTQAIFTDSINNRGRSLNETPIQVPKSDSVESQVENRRNIYNNTNYDKIDPLGKSEGTKSSFKIESLAGRNGIYGSSIESYITNPKTIAHINMAGATVKQEDIKEIVLNSKYKNNHTPLTVPHFETAYHSHYYGENPPPQFVVFPKNVNVPFNDITPVRSESVWYKNNFHRHVAGTTGIDHDVKCFCQNDYTDVNIRNGLNWYPSVKRLFDNNPGSQINDKLAPLA